MLEDISSIGYGYTNNILQDTFKINFEQCRTLNKNKRNNDRKTTNHWIAQKKIQK